MNYCLIYLLIINVIGFFIMMVDKHRAKRGAWRIPEKTLFTIAILFGSLGVSLGMKKFRHKTKHKSFVIGIPVIEIVQLLILIAVYYRWCWSKKNIHIYRSNNSTMKYWFMIGVYHLYSVVLFLVRFVRMDLLLLTSYDFINM